jgi:hypothetical protein
MAGDHEQQSFWKSLPGILTAFAGIITAIAALVGALVAGGVIGGGGNGETPTPTTRPAVVASPTTPLVATASPTADGSEGVDTNPGFAQYYIDLDPILDEFWFPIDSLFVNLQRQIEESPPEALEVIFGDQLAVLIDRSLEFEDDLRELIPPDALFQQHNDLIDMAAGLDIGLIDIEVRGPRMADYPEFQATFENGVVQIRVACEELQRLADVTGTPAGLLCNLPSTR